MKLVSGIVDSGLFAQSALSAEIATKDSLGRNISETYLTSVNIPESANWNATTTVVNNNSAIWNNTTNVVSGNSAQWGASNPQIPVTGINGIKISESGDKVVFEVSADYATEDWVTAQGYLTAETDWTNTITAASANAYEQATAAIPAPFDPTYLSGQIDTKLNSAIYAADSGTFLTAVPDTYLQNTDLTITSGKITEISGVPLSAGDELPSGVMNTSALEYNAVNEISGYNGSAIAQYGAEKQWLVTDDTLLTLSNSAQFAIGVNISAVQQLMGIDETELLNSTATSAFTLTEPLTGFKAVKIKLRWWDKVPDNYYDVERFTTGKLSLSWTYFDNISDASPLELVGASWTSNNGINYNLEAGFARVFGTASSGMANFTHAAYPLSIVGIGRKS